MIGKSEKVNHIVHANSYLTLHYRITLASGPGAGSVFMDTFTGNPATLLMGSNQWLPAMEEPLLGKQEGDAFSFTLTALQAYGEKNPELLQRVTKKMLAEHAGENTTFESGDMVEFTAPNGGRYSGVFKEWGDTWALFDFNHPLAGLDLKVDVSLLGVM